MSSPASAKIARQKDVGLAGSEQSLQLLVHGIKDHAILMLDPDGFVLTWNEGAERIKGYPYDGSDVKTLIENADSAMYKAKQNGRPTVQFFQPDAKSHCGVRRV